MTTDDDDAAGRTWSRRDGIAFGLTISAAIVVVIATLAIAMTANAPAGIG